MVYAYRMNEAAAGDKQFFSDVIEIICSDRNTAYRAVNSAMIETYWLIGKRIVEQEQHGKERAEYGERLLKNLSSYLTETVGKGFSTANLKNFRQFFLVFPHLDQFATQCAANLSWTHIRCIMRVENEKARLFYIEECAKSRWSSRQLERQINTRFYERLLSSQDKSGWGRYNSGRLVGIFFWRDCGMIYLPMF